MFVHFYWVVFRSTKSSIRVHTQLDLKTAIPAFTLFSNADVHEVNALDIILFEANSFQIMDRGYVDYRRFYKIHFCKAFFITRAKDNMNFGLLYSHAVDKSKSVLCDQTILLKGYYAAKDYPEKVRRIKFRDHETGKTFLFLTNNFHLAAADIAQLYKNRWKIELFFKWIKQHLKIKSFLGQSENSVKKQIWIAVSVYVLIAIANKEIHASAIALRNSTDLQYLCF